MENINHQATPEMAYATVDLLEDMEILENIVEPVELVLDSDLRMDLPAKVSSENKDSQKEEYSMQLNTILKLLQSKDPLSMVETANEMYSNVTQKYRDNQKAILQEIRDYEVVVRSVNSFFENASYGGSDVENAFFMTVNPALFASSENARDFKAMSKLLQDKYFARRLTESPAYICYIGDIENGADKMAEIAKETIALSIVDVMEAKSKKSFGVKLRDRNVSDVTSDWGHLVVNSNWLVARKAYQDIETQPFAIPGACAILGKLLKTNEGDSAAGFEGGLLKGIHDVLFHTDTRDDKFFRENGRIILDKEDGAVRIFGDRTAIAENTTNPMLKKISKMRVYNGIMKDLIDFCNVKAYSKWGMKQKKKFKELVEEYLNGCIFKGKIQGYSELEIIERSDEEVEVVVKLKFFQTKSQFTIHIEGRKDKFRRVEEAKDK